MPEFELHFLASRMRGGILAKARRGELTLSLPTGLAYDEHRQAAPDPTPASARPWRCYPAPSPPPGQPSPS